MHITSQSILGHGAEIAALVVLLHSSHLLALADPERAYTISVRSTCLSRVLLLLGVLHLLLLLLLLLLLSSMVLVIESLCIGSCLLERRLLLVLIGMIVHLLLDLLLPLGVLHGCGVHIKAIMHAARPVDRTK